MFSELQEKKHYFSLKIAILTREDYRSPRILAESLKFQLEQAGAEAKIFYYISLLNRLVGYTQSKLSFHFWLKKIISNYLFDKKQIRQLKNYDAIIISECTPNAFWRKLYNVEKLKNILQIPILIYEVYYLGNAPSQEAVLKQNKDALLQRFDGHLFVSPVTEIRQQNLYNAYCIGLLAKSWDLKPLPKKELIALVDFSQPGYEAYREIQIGQLTKAGISFIVLEKSYSIEEIRDIYRRISIYFVQFPEAFGLPILECLCTGAQIFTPNSGWPMSWRLDEKPEVHGSGILPDCFTVYHSEDDLLHKLLAFKEIFSPSETPLQVFNEFVKTYPAFYAGDQSELNRFIDFIKSYKN
jgi:hypothetical protein